MQRRYDRRRGAVAAALALSSALLAPRGLRQIASDGARKLPARQSGWQIEIDPWDGLVAGWR